jgi:serine/threonine-protein kinase RsbW
MLLQGQLEARTANCSAGIALDTSGFSRETAFKGCSDGAALPSLFPQMETRSLEKPGAGRWKFKLPSTMESVSEVEAAAEQFATEAGVDEDERFRLTMAVREAAVNAVLHGNDYDPAKKISASFENDGKSIVIKIGDEGRGLDPETLPDPLAPENLMRGTGRGIFLIRSFMDEVHFRQLHPGTEMTLVKHLPPAAAAT